MILHRHKIDGVAFFFFNKCMICLTIYEISQNFKKDEKKNLTIKIVLVNKFGVRAFFKMFIGH